MKNKITTRKKIFILSLSLITIISAILTFVFVFSNKVEAIEIKKAYGKYESTQDIYEGKENTNTSTFISMTDAENSTSIENKTITIATPSELILFSNLCDPKNKSYNENFLRYNYKLLNNIDCSKNRDSFIPIGYDKAFSGTFDGNGFEIKYLNFINLVSNNDNVTKYLYSSDNETNTHIQYFAMFSKNNGTIKNLGLISPRIVLSYNPRGAAYIAPLVGENNGTVEYCYHKMLESNEDNSSGISSQGGFFVSGLVSINKETGKISYVYSAVSILSQTASTEVLTQAEIVNVNSGTVENAYFYDSTIRSYVENNNKVSITFDPSKVNSDLKDADHPGIYCNSLSDLTSKISNAKNNYYSLNSYNETIQKYLKNSNNEFIYETPVLRGIKNANGNILTINNANEFYYMYELFNLNSHFASSEFTYLIANDIDMSLIGIPTVTTQINATIKSSNENSNITIFNAPLSDYYITNMGIDCYGLFPWFSGKLSNIDVVLGSTNTKYEFTPKESNNKKAFGALVGYLDGGEIDNCNVYINATFDDNINEYSVGGVVGYLGSISNSIVGTISNTIVNGTIENTSSSSSTATTNFNKLGGLVGFIDYTTGSITNVLSTVSIISNAKSNLAIGGILGAGYTNKFINNQYGKKVDSTLNGTITINGSFEYASGIIGRLLGVSNQIDSITNYGNISLNSQSNNESYLSSLMNVDIIKTATTLPVSSLPLNNSGEYLFYASQLNSDCNIAVNGKNLKMHLSNGLNINTKNAFTTKITGLYNSTAKSGNSSSLYLNNISNFSGLINSICDNNTSSMIYLDTVLNSKNFTFNSNNTIEASITVSSIANGKNINFVDIRNNGNLSFELDNQTSNNPNLIVNGVFEELSLNTSANNIYNAGNISINDKKTTATINTIDINIYASGICYKNLAVLKDDSQNPLKASYDTNEIGSLNNVINNGKILITSDNLDKNMSVYVQNTSSRMAEKTKQNSTIRLNGSVYASGISYLNEGIISNGFNLANIELDVYSRTDTNKYVIGGIAAYLNGQYAQIRDSANDGTLQLINISNIKNGYCYVGGIVGLNNYNYSNTQLDSINSIIAFTINYGTLVGFNGTDNVEINTNNIKNYSSYVGGIMAYGAANTINVVNYGNIYGNEVVSSIVAGLDMSIYKNVDFYLANTINYGRVYLLEKYNYSGYLFNVVSFNSIDVINNPTASLKYTKSGLYDANSSNYYYSGAMFGLVDFSNGNSAKPNIRYVINLYSAPIVQSGNQINKPSSKTDTSTFITVNGSTDSFGGGSIKYAPMTSISDSNGNIGVFSKDFIFRKAIDKDSSAVDFTKYLTDNYIADFFEFIRFDKINTILLDKIGWRSIAYANAAEILAKNIELMSKFVSNDNLTKENFIAPFNSTTWVSNIDTTIISDFLTYSIKTTELKDQYSNIINEVIFGDNYKSSITNEIRTKIIENLIKDISTYSKEEYKDLLQDLLYDELLAKMISGENTDYQVVQSKVKELLNSAGEENLRLTLNNYLEMIVKDNLDISKMFENDTNNYYLQKKIDLINTLLAGYSTETITKMAMDIVGATSSDEVGVKAYLSLNSNQDIAKNIYSIMVVSNSNSENSDYISALNKAFKKYDISTYISDVTSISDTYPSTKITTGAGTTQTTSYPYTYINGSKITYEKDYTELWNIIKNNKNIQNIITDKYLRAVTDPTSSVVYKGLIAKATEYNNTYQSNDGPSSLDETDNNKKDGLIQIKNDSTLINNRFIYTPDSVNSTATYYYGPFDKKGDLFSKNLGNDYQSLGRNIYDAINIGNTKNYYVPVFISTNNDITKEKIAKSNTTANYKDIATYYWHNYYANNSTPDQWVSDYIVDSRGDDCQRFIYRYANSNNNYVVDGYNFAPTYKPTYKTDDAVRDNKLTVGITNQGGYLVASQTQKHENRDYYLKGYISTSIYTGIWYMASYWVDENNKLIGVYLMSQNDNNHSVKGYKGVQTTQYTYYTMDDLLKLDGIRTKSIDDPTRKDDTEVSIISALITNLLKNDTNNTVKKAIVQAVAEYAHKNDFKTTEYRTVNLLANALVNTPFANASISNIFALLPKSTLENITYTDPSDTENNNLYKKLQSLIKNSQYTIKENLISLATTDKEYFKKLLLATLTDLTKYNNDSNGKEISNYDFTYFLYRYIDYLKENGISDENISKYIISNINDLGILSDLANTDWDKFIDMYDGNADGNADGFGGTLDVMELHQRMGLIKSYGGSTYSSMIGDYNTTTGKSSNLSGSSVMPFMVTNKIDIDTYKANSTKSDYIEDTSPNNIGYYVASESKVYSLDKNLAIGKSISNSEYKIYTTKTSNTGYFETTISDHNVSKFIKNLINQDTLYGVQLRSMADMNKTATNNIIIKNVKYEKAILPKNVIWFTPSEDGIIKLVLATGDKGYIPGFKIVTITRNNSDESIPLYSRKITGFNNYSPSGFDASWTSDMKSGNNELKNSLVYFEIPVSKNIEYCLTGLNSVDDNTSFPMILYLDLGQNGSSNTAKYPDLSKIETNYTNYYLNKTLTTNTTDNSLSNFGLYLASNFINTIYSKKTSTTLPESITVNNPSILLVRAKLGTVTINGSTTYTYKESQTVTDTGTEITIDKVLKSFNNDGYRAFYLSGGTYKITPSTDCEITELLLIDKEASFSYNTTDSSVDTIKVKSDKNSIEGLLYTGAKYEDLNAFKINLYNNTTTSYNNKIIETLATVYSTYTSTIDNKTIYNLFAQDYMKNLLNSTNSSNVSNYMDLIEAMLKADYDGKESVFGKLISKVSAETLIKQLIEIADYDLDKNIMTSIISICNQEGKSYTTVNKYIIAAYLGQDYLNNTKQLTNTKLYELLKTYENGQYQFILNDTSIDSDKFIEFIKHLGGQADIEGYGIFALASSQGIKNGKFIPDNLELQDLDNNNFETTSSAWRGDKNTIGTVNYHFYVSMKQLKKSISTSIIEMDLIDSNNNKYFANNNQITINGSTGTITYYITKSQYDSINGSFTIDRDNLVIASKATIYIGLNDSYNELNDNNKTFTITKANNTLTTDTKIKVIAEDTTVETIYRINFIIIDNDTTDYTYTLTSDVTLESTGGDVTLTFTTTNPNLNNSDLSSFINIEKDNKSYNYLNNRDEFKKYFSFYTTGFYQVVKKNDSNYVATIKYSVNQSLPYGDYKVSINVGTKPYITMTKHANSEANIKYIEFDHQSVNVNATMPSSILFGRTFEDNDFIMNEDNIPNYLTDFRISSNATVTIKYEITTTNSGLRQFIVTYDITAENGITKNKYTHILAEKAPFDSSYATIYKDGNILKTDTTNVKYALVNNANISASDVLNLSFTRNEGVPTYRIYFNLNNFYIDSNTSFGLEDKSETNKIGMSHMATSYAGLTASVTENCELGTYSYQYSYTDKLGRIFYFPIVNITKEYSTDSLISELTFISSNISLGSVYTIVNPNYAFIPNENTSDNQKNYHYDENEKYYSGFKNSDVTVTNGKMVYSDNASLSGTNYYILGTVSDVQLSDYAPTMIVDEYAEVYQYTTNKIIKYNGNQTQSDTDILNTDILKTNSSNNIVYLYVPFYTDDNQNGNEDETDTHSVYLVKMTIENGKKIISTVYNTSGVSDNDKVGEFNKNSELKNIHSLSITVGGKTYYVSKYAGKKGNVSLNMNYIGNPSDGHFWYVSYAVFSESYLYKDSDTASINYYHISIVDLTNNIYFKIKVNTDKQFENSAIYLTISYVTYDKDNNQISNTLSCYAIKLNELNNDIYTFTTQYDLAMLPSGYFKFYLELPHGYSVTYTASKENKLTNTDTHYEDNKGSYLPPSSVVPQQIELIFNVKETTDISNSLWGEGTTSTVTKEAEYQASTKS